MEICRPLVLRVNPDSSEDTARRVTIESLAEFLEQYPADERAAELARIIGHTVNVLEARVEPKDALSFHALGFYTLAESFTDK